MIVIDFLIVCQDLNFQKKRKEIKIISCEMLDFMNYYNLIF